MDIKHEMQGRIAVDPPQMIYILNIRAILFLNDEITHVRVKISIIRLLQFFQEACLSVFLEFNV